MDIQGKVAVITGAAAGIGRATAVALANAGARMVVLADVDEVGLSESKLLVGAAGAEALSVVTDVTDIAALEALYKSAMDQCGQIDIVFNNAGIVSGPPPFPDTPLQRIQRVIAIDLTSVIVSTQIAVRHMKGRGGVIINTSSTGGLSPFLADAPYAAAKAGVIMFSQSCADLNESMNIRVNAVCPGVTETAILEKLGGGKRPDWLGPITEHIELLEPEDIAQAVLDIIKDDQLVGDYVVVENKAVTG